MNRSARKTVFLSMVSDEFGSLRKSMKTLLERAGHRVETQESWGALGASTLEKLNHFVRDCDVVVHIIGDAVGYIPPKASVETLCREHPALLSSDSALAGLSPDEIAALSYTQWEAYLATYHDIDLRLYRAVGKCARDKRYRDYEPDRKVEERERQWAHFSRLCDKLGLDDRAEFSDRKKLTESVVADLNQTRHRAVFDVPSLPPHYQEIPGLVDRAVDTLLGEVSALGITSDPNSAREANLGLHGMGGIGKTVLAIAVAHDDRIRKRFDDGVVWIKLGQETDETKLLTRQSEVYEKLERVPRTFSDIPNGRSSLDTIFQERRCLLILDDVWDLAHAQAFGKFGPKSRLLITTQQESIVRGLDAAEQKLNALSREDALKLLARTSRTELSQLPPEAGLVAEKCGNLPLALAISGKMIAESHGEYDWSNVLDFFRAVDLERLEAQFGESYPHPNLLVALAASVDCIPEKLGLRERYQEIAVFPHDQPLPNKAIITLWTAAGLSEGKAKHNLVQLLHRGLLQKDKTTGLYSLHYLQLDYLKHQYRGRPDELRALHRRLLDGYAGCCDDAIGWPSGPDDGYFFQFLTLHLCGARQREVLRDLLLRYDWLEAKLRAASLQAKVTNILGDYVRYFEAFGEDRELRLVSEALRLSSDVLSADGPGGGVSQLPGQLLGRLLDEAAGSPAIAELLQKAREACRVPSLLPLRRNLTTPGGPLIRILRGHESGVNGVAAAMDGVVSIDDQLLHKWDLLNDARSTGLKLELERTLGVTLTIDGRRAICACQDNTLKVVELSAEGEVMGVLKGHTKWVRAVTLVPQRTQVVSGSSDGSVRVWDYVRGEQLAELTGHDGPVVGVAVTPDGRRIVSACHDWTLKVWDLATLTAIATFKHDHRCVWGVAITNDGETVISCAADLTVRTWSIASGTELQRFQPAHTAAVRAVALSPDGRTVVTGSEDQTVRVWDLEAGKLLSRPLRGHSGPIVSVAISPDGRTAYSGSADRTVMVWDLDKVRSSQQLEGHFGPVKSVAVTAAGDAIVSGADDQTLQVWNAQLGRVGGPLRGHSGAVLAVDVTPDGKTAVSGSQDQTLIVWDLQSREMRGKPLTGHRGPIRTVALAEDGATAISGSEDRTLIVWNLITGEELTRFCADAPILACVISPDGETVVAGDDHDRVHFLKLSLGSERAARRPVRRAEPVG